MGSVSNVIHQDHDYNKVRLQATKAAFKALPVESKKIRSVTEFFAVRRSVRKTKKEVQEERMRNIEKAIRDGREEGLEVSFEEFYNENHFTKVGFFLGPRLSQQRPRRGDDTSVPARRICD